MRSQMYLVRWLWGGLKCAEMLENVSAGADLVFTNLSCEIALRRSQMCRSVSKPELWSRFCVHKCILLDGFEAVSNAHQWLKQLSSGAEFVVTNVSCQIASVITTRALCERYLNQFEGNLSAICARSEGYHEVI